MRPYGRGKHEGKEKQSKISLVFITIDNLKSRSLLGLVKTYFHFYQQLKRLWKNEGEAKQFTHLFGFHHRGQLKIVLPHGMGKHEEIYPFA